MGWLIACGCAGLGCLGWRCLAEAAGRGCPLSQASHCGGLSCGAQASAATAAGSVVAASGFQSTGLAAVAQRLRCPKACGDLPRPGIEPMPPAWACGFFPTEPPRKSTHCDFV